MLAALALSRASAAPRRHSSTVPSFLLNTPETKITTLPNGFRVASEHAHGKTATVGVFIDSGSAAETKANNGAAHFLEHISFKGTNTRSREQLERSIEDIGAQLNAYTSREQTVYYARVFKEDVGSAVNILGDILQNSKLSDADIEKERSVILREMQEVDSQTEEVIFDHLHSVAYQGTSHGYTILGPKENIQTLTRAHLLDYIKTNYVGSRMVLAASGDVQHEELVKLAEQQFGGLAKQSATPYVHEAPLYTAGGVSVRNDEMPLLHAAYAFQGVGWSHPDYYVFATMQTLLGAWNRNTGAATNLISPLAERVSTEELAHSFSAFSTPYHETGLFGVYVVSPADKAEDLAYEVFREFGRLSMSITDAEVARAKKKMQTALLGHLDGTAATAEDIGRQVLALGRRMSAAEVWQRIENVTAADVKRVASQRIYDNDPLVALVGPSPQLVDYNQLRDWSAWRRL